MADAQKYETEIENISQSRLRCFHFVYPPQLSGVSLRQTNFPISADFPLCLSPIVFCLNGTFSPTESHFTNPPLNHHCCQPVQMLSIV